MKATRHEVEKAIVETVTKAYDLDPLEEGQERAINLAFGSNIQRVLMSKHKGNVFITRLAETIYGPSFDKWLVSCNGIEKVATANYFQLDKTEGLKAVAVFKAKLAAC